MVSDSFMAHLKASKMKIKISVILCTYNGEGFVENCLNSILSQTYKNFEVLCLDGGSSDKTKEIIKHFSSTDKRVKFLINKKRFPDGKGFGKWFGGTIAKGDIIAHIDQDNILQDKDLFKKAVEIHRKEKNLIGVLAGLKHDSNDARIVRYVALVGTDSFFAYRSLDFLRNLNSNVKSVEKFKISLDNTTITGGNCFFYSKKGLDSVEGYDRDTLCIPRLIKKGRDRVFVINDATKHYAEKSLPSLIKKKIFWALKYSGRNSEEKANYFPRTATKRNAFFKNVGFNLLILPNLHSSLKLYARSKDTISFLFPLMAFINTSAYVLWFIKEKILN